MPVRPKPNLSDLAEEAGLYLKIDKVILAGQELNEYTVCLASDREAENGHWISSRQPEMIRAWLNGFRAAQKSGAQTESLQRSQDGTCQGE